MAGPSFLCSCQPAALRIMRPDTWYGQAMASDIEKFKKYLEQWSEDHIRYLLKTGKIKKREKVALAEEALRRKEQVREEELERCNQASIQEQIDIARSAKDASWAAVDKAKKANWISIFAFVLAFAALGFSIAVWLSAP